ncbi:hypothetical protein MHK_005269 [Candidatus Magnetomorum sp. HK-1]|nr:hypothetical protein MHK_005269 [Candidatus Magnetomorum sp. HK-1]
MDLNHCKDSKKNIKKGEHNKKEYVTPKVKRHKPLEIISKWQDSSSSLT